MNKDIVIGSVVYSTMGRDKKRYYIVFEIVNDEYVLITDGKFRTLEKPKLKKIKHLKLNGVKIENLAEKILLKKQIFDIEIIKALREFNSPQSEM